MWRLVPRPNKKKPIGVKWIYKEKKNAKGDVERYKAWLVAKHYSQKQGINYNEVFALIDNIKGKLQEIEDVQARKLISFGKVNNPKEVWKKKINVKHNGETTFINFL